ncbi:hypothetical protein K438DRAFT_1813433, partial [Mycena galopus ATCC 62051]
MSVAPVRRLVSAGLRARLLLQDARSRMPTARRLPQDPPQQDACRKTPAARRSRPDACSQTPAVSPPTIHPRD